MAVQVAVGYALDVDMKSVNIGMYIDMLMCEYMCIYIYIYIYICVCTYIYK
jgi:hypothetical protein